MKHLRRYFFTFLFFAVLSTSATYAGDFDDDYRRAYRAYVFVKAVQRHVYSEESVIDSRITQRYFVEQAAPFWDFQHFWDYAKRPDVWRLYSDNDSFRDFIDALPSRDEAIQEVCAKRQPKPRMYVFVDKLHNSNHDHPVNMTGHDHPIRLADIGMDDIDVCDEHVDRDRHFEQYDVVSLEHFSDDTCDHVPHCCFEWDKSQVLDDDIFSIHARQECFRWDFTFQIYILKQFIKKYGPKLPRDEL